MKIHQRNLSIFFVLTATTATLIVFVIWPASNMLRDNYLNIKSEKEKMKTLLAEGKSVQKNQENLRTITGQLDTLDNIFLKAGDELTFITSLEARARENNLSQTIVFDNEKILSQEMGIKVVPLSLELQGGLENIISYINDLDTLDYYININTIDINKEGSSNTKQYPQQVEEEGTNEPKEVQLRVRIEALTYWK